MSGIQSPPPSVMDPNTNPKAAAKAAKAYAKASRPWFRKKRWWLAGLGVLVIIIAVAGGSGGGTDITPTATDISSSQSSDTATKDKAASPVAPEPTKQAEPDLTPGQENALKSAENYLSFAPFSRSGLIKQLSSSAGDGYSVKDATYAADHVEVDWNEQAAKAAKNYLDMTSFSRSGLIKQLSSSAGDGYTIEQATYGVKKAGL